MREIADADRIWRFMRALGSESSRDARVYFTGGATAVLIGWRASTIDVDMKVVPDDDRVFRAIPRLKESLQINVELASPADFIPVRAGWEERSPFIARDGKLQFHHFEFLPQALAKLERGHTQDLEDVREMVRRQLVNPDEAREYFKAIERELHRYPAVDPPSFRRAVDEMFGAGRDPRR